MKPNKAERFVLRHYNIGWDKKDIMLTLANKFKLNYLVQGGWCTKRLPPEYKRALSKYYER